MTVGKHPHPLKVARELDDFNSRLDRQAAAAIRDLHAQRDMLLEALQRLIGGTTSMQDALEANQQARAAIAKATGGEA